MSRTPKPIAAEVTEVILRLIASHRGKPCPTRREIVAWTGLPRREVWPFLKDLAGREPPLNPLDEGGRVDRAPVLSHRSAEDDERLVTRRADSN